MRQCFHSILAVLLADLRHVVGKFVLAPLMTPILKLMVSERVRRLGDTIDHGQSLDELAGKTEGFDIIRQQPLLHRGINATHGIPRMR